jgi:glycosyltransferase involved in cell wall biosynthesis
MTASSPLVSLVVPCYQERDAIEACLATLFGQDYPPDRLEVLIAEGGSTDGTREILDRIAAGEPRLRIVDNPARLQAPGMNAAIRASRGDVIVRMDAHCEYASDYVRRSVEVLLRTGADNVGGAQRMLPRTAFQKALAAALSSPFGAGGARYRSTDAEGFTDTVFLGAFRRRVFEEVGLFDPGAVTNEDAELNQRIREAGGRVYLSREVVVGYLPRRSLGKLALQYYRYGRGRARTLLKHRRLGVLRPAIPFLSLCAAAVLLAVPALRPVALPAFGLYALLLLTFAARAARGLGLAAVARLCAIFPVMQLAHAAGFAAGLARYAVRPDWRAPEKLPPRPAPPDQISEVA